MKCRTCSFSNFINNFYNFIDNIMGLIDEIITYIDELTHIISNNQYLLLFFWVKNAYKCENNWHNFGKYWTIMPTFKNNFQQK